MLKKVQNNQANQEQATLTKRLIHENENTFENSYPTYSNMDVYNANLSNFEEDNKKDALNDKTSKRARIRGI